MKNIKLKKHHILVTLILVFVAVLLVLNINKNSDPFEVIHKRHIDLLKDQELISIKNFILRTLFKSSFLSTCT